MRIFLWLATAGLLTIATPTLAQQAAGKTPQDRAAHRTETMTHDLGLSEAQAVKVKEINQQFADQLVELKPTDTERSVRRERREKAQQMRADYDARLKEVLTPEQYAKHQTLQQERREERRTRRHEAGGAGIKGGKAMRAPGAKPSAK